MRHDAAHCRQPEAGAFVAPFVVKNGSHILQAPPAYSRACVTHIDLKETAGASIGDLHSLAALSVRFAAVSVSSPPFGIASRALMQRFRRT